MDAASAMNTAAAAGNKALAVGYWTVLIILILAICGFILYRFSFNCKVRILYLTQGKDQISDKRGKVIKDRKDGIEKLVIAMGFFRSVKMPTPPPEATALDLKGKRCFWVEFGDDGSKRYIQRERSTNKYIPLSTNDRVFYLNEDEKMMQRQKKGLSELIAQAIPYIALCIILGMLLAFWGDVVKPLQEENAKWRAYTSEMTKQQAAITADLRQIIKKEQVVKSEPTPVVVDEIRIAAEDNKPPPE